MDLTPTGTQNEHGADDHTAWKDFQSAMNKRSAGCSPHIAGVRDGTTRG
jgi:hypothetical protein